MGGGAPGSGHPAGFMVESKGTVATIFALVYALNSWKGRACGAHPSIRR